MQGVVWAAEIYPMPCNAPQGALLRPSSLPCMSGQRPAEIVPVLGAGPTFEPHPAPNRGQTVYPEQQAFLEIQNRNNAHGHRHPHGISPSPHPGTSVAVQVGRRRLGTPVKGPRRSKGQAPPG
jgi:hypothetical protein